MFQIREGFEAKKQKKKNKTEETGFLTQQIKRLIDCILFLHIGLELACSQGRGIFLHANIFYFIPLQEPSLQAESSSILCK